MIADGTGAAATVKGKANAAWRYMLRHRALTTVQCAQTRVEERPGKGIEFMQLDGEIRSLMNKVRVQLTSKVSPSSPWSVGLTLPTPEHLAFYAGVGAMAVFGIMEWPVVAALVVGHTLVNAQHNKVLQSLGEALEEA
jgi:hypothetical protein